MDNALVNYFLKMSRRAWSAGNVALYREYLARAEAMLSQPKQECLCGTFVLPDPSGLVQCPECSRAGDCPDSRFIPNNGVSDASW